MKRHHIKWIVVLSLVVVSMAVRLMASTYLGIEKPLVSDAREYDRLAYHLSIGEGYTVKNNIPYVNRAPMFPLFLALFYKLFGYGVVVARVSVCFLGALIVFFIYLLGKEAFSQVHGLMAAVIAAFYPPLVYASYTVLSENLFTLLFLIATLLVLLAYNRKRTRSLVCLSGVAFGLSALTRPITLILPAFLFPWFLYVFRLKKGLFLFLLFSAAFLVVQVPWTVRNFKVFNTFIIGTAKGGIDLWWSNNPKVMSNDLTKGRQVRYFPSSVQHSSIIEKNREAYKLAYAFFKEEMGQLPKMILYKQKNFWNAMAGEGLYFQLLSLFTYGIILPFYILTNLRIIVSPNERIIFPLIGLFFVFVTSLYYGTVRFRLPLEPFILILGSEGILWVKRKIWGKAGVRIVSHPETTNRGLEF